MNTPKLTNCPHCKQLTDAEYYECRHCGWELGFSTHSDDTPTIGERIVIARQRCGMSQTDLANAIGMARYKYISVWETGHVSPSAYYIRRLALALNVSADWLLGLED